MNIESFLKDRAVSFEMLPHRREYTASRTAHSLHVPGTHFAKTVVLKVNDRPVLAIVPANHSVNMSNVESVLGAEHAELASEHELVHLFPDCELGAIPPFGSQYGMDTVIDDRLAEDDHIVFDGNTHEQAVCMRYADFANVEHPHVAHITSGLR